MTTKPTDHSVTDDEVSGKEDAATKDENADLMLSKPQEPETSTTAPTQKNEKIHANPQEAEKKEVVSHGDDTTEEVVVVPVEQEAVVVVEETVVVVVEETQSEESKEGEDEQVTAEPKVIDAKEDQSVIVQDDQDAEQLQQQRSATTTTTHHEVPLLRTSLRILGNSLKDVFIGHLPHVGIIHGGTSDNNKITEEQVKTKFIPRHKWDKVMEYLNQQQEEKLLLQDELKHAAEDDRVALKIKKQNEEQEAPEASEAPAAKEEEEDDVAKKDLDDEGEEIKKKPKEEEEEDNDENTRQVELEKEKLREEEEKKMIEETLLLTSTQSFTEDEDSILKTLDDTVEDLKHKQDSKEMKKHNKEEEAATADIKKKDDVSSAAAAFQDKDDQKGRVTIHDDNILHLVCRHHPPVCIVTKIIKLYHYYVSELNSLNECPLHVAASHGASPQIIQLLINSYPLAVSWQDIRGRTPLHGHLYECCSFDYEHKKYCCDPGHYMVENKQDEKLMDDDIHINYKPLLVQGPLHDVIQNLCKHMTSDDMGIKDKFHHIPLDIAKYYDCENVTLAIIKEAM